MKKSFILSAVMMLVASTLAFAQTPQGKARPSKEQMAQMQAVKIAEQLMLDEGTSSKFIPLYKEYKSENRAINEKYRKPKVKPAEGEAPAVKTDAEVDKEIRDQFAKSQEVLDLRKSYYEKFLKILSPKQIQQMYKLEKEQANGAMSRRDGNGPAHKHGRPVAPMAQ